MYTEVVDGDVTEVVGLNMEPRPYAAKYDPETNKTTVYYKVAREA